jgi:fatty acid desaturase
MPPLRWSNPGHDTRRASSLVRGAGCRELNSRLRRREKNVLDIPFYRTGHNAHRQSGRLSVKVKTRFYEKVIKVKADVAALLCLISVFFVWPVSSTVPPILIFLTFLVLGGFCHISAENLPLGSLRSDDWQLSRPTGPPFCLSCRETLLVELRSLVEWFSLLLELAPWHPHSASPFRNPASSSFCFGRRTF